MIEIVAYLDFVICINIININTFLNININRKFILLALRCGDSSLVGGWLVGGWWWCRGARSRHEQCGENVDTPLAYVGSPLGDA